MFDIKAMYSWIICLLALWKVTSANVCTESFHGTCLEIHQGMNGGCDFNHKYTLNFCGPYQMCCFSDYPQGMIVQTQPPVTWQPAVTSYLYYTTKSPVVQPSFGHPSGTCGTTMDYGLKMVGGSSAHNGQFPWQVSLQYNGPMVGGKRKHLCGGTLVSSQWVITASHCFHQVGDKPTEWVVGLGLQNQVTGPESKFVHVTNIYKNEQFVFDGHPMRNDIAMMKLSKPVDIYGRNVRTACIPNANDNFDNDMCVISGWGSHYFAQPAPPVSQTLEYVDVQTMPNSQCSYYNGASNVLPNTICAGHTIQNGGHGPCTGDSGGPLVCKKNGVWTLAGITSWGSGCAEPGKPGIYTRVTSFAQWIETHMKYY